MQKLLKYFINKNLEEFLCLKCLGSQMLTRYFILWRSHCLKTVKQFPRFIHRKLKRETLSPVLNLCSLQPQHTTSPESWLQKIKSSFIPPFIQCMCNELSDMQATPFIRGSKKRRKNLLEINFTGSRIVSDYSTESTQSTPQILSHTNRTGCPHFLCCFPPYSTPQDTCQWPGTGTEC